MEAEAAVEMVGNLLLVAATEKKTAAAVAAAAAAALVSDSSAVVHRLPTDADRPATVGRCFAG